MTRMFSLTDESPEVAEPVGDSVLRFNFLDLEVLRQSIEMG